MRLATIAFAAWLGIAKAEACSSPEGEFHITRTSPLRTLPQGVVQLQVNVPLDEEKMRSMRSGTITVPVVQTLSGDFNGLQVTFSFEAFTSCHYFGPTGLGLYIVVLPLRYAEGDPVLGAGGRPEISALFLPAEGEPDFSNFMYPDFAKLPNQLSCVRRAEKVAANNPAAVCSEADDPGSLFNP